MKEVKQVKIRIPYWDGTEMCAKLGQGLFYDNSSRTIANRKDLKFIRELCANCHRLSECRTYGIKHEQHGFWGGMTEQERKEYRKKYRVELIRPEMYSDLIPKFERGVEKNNDYLNNG